MVALKRNRMVVAALGLIGLAAVFAPSLMTTRAEEALDRKMWQAVAPGRVEPWSGEIRIGSAAMGRVGEVLVKINDTVFAGEAMIRIDDDEARNRHAKAELQYNLRKRARPAATGKNAERRKHEDAVGDAESAVVDSPRRRRSRRGGETRRQRLRRSPRDRTQDPRQRARTAPAAPHRARQIRGRREHDRAERTRRPIFDGAHRPARRRSRPRQPDRARADRRDRVAGQYPCRRARVAVGAAAADRARRSLEAARARRDRRARLWRHQSRDNASWCARRRFAAATSPARCPRSRRSSTPGRIGARGQRNLTDVNVAEVVIDLAETGPLAVGMKVDVYFSRDAAK